MSDDSDFDGDAHERLLESVAGKTPKRKVKKSTVKVNADDLLNSIKKEGKTKNDSKRRVDLDKKDAKRRGKKTLSTPIHRQERERIQSAVGYIELKKDLAVWKDVVEAQKTADQLQFPLHQERVLTVDSAADKASSFRPKTELELEMAKMLGSSKNRLSNDTEYTEAEMEIIRAMDVKEAKSKLAAMQKMRALVSYREAKNRYMAKIKSKGYHRILKRQKRRQLVKEFDELLVKDPEAAKEKLKELETQRVIERASLRHRARNKFQQEILKHAGRDPKAKAVLDEQLRLGRELREKVGADSESETDEKSTTNVTEVKKKSVADMIRDVAMAVHKDMDDTVDDVSTLSAAAGSKMQLFEMRARKRQELAQGRVQANAKNGVTATEKAFEENDEWANGLPTEDAVADGPSMEDAIPVTETGSAKKTKKKKKHEKKLNITQMETSDNGDDEVVDDDQDIDAMFNDAEKQIVSRLQKEARKVRFEENLDNPDETEEKPKKKKKSKKSVEESEESIDRKKAEEMELDPRHFLQLETAAVGAVADELEERMDQFDQEQLVAEAFKDDDVIAEFEDEREAATEAERPKDIDLDMMGWGRWAGPGISERKRRGKFLVKAAAKKRRDDGKRGVLIKEAPQETPMQKLQPKSLPFPYTRVEDFEAVMKQPLGKEWNPVRVAAEMCKSSVVTQAGRTIRPLDKAEALRKVMHDSEPEDD